MAGDSQGVAEPFDFPCASALKAAMTLAHLLLLEKSSMSIQNSNLSSRLVLALGVALLVSACNRQEPALVAPVASSPIVAAPTTTTVGTVLDDTVVTARVKSALLADVDTKGFEISVETRKGMVLLGGFVDSPLQVTRALAVTSAIEGVQGVENGMTLKEGHATVGNQLDDGITTTRVKSALLADATVKSAEISVITRKGEVQLSGFIDSQARIDRAIAVTRSVEGVTSVTNKMEIKQ